LPGAPCRGRRAGGAVLKLPGALLPGALCRGRFRSCVFKQSESHQL
jgi:hypothetical protein